MFNIFTKKPHEFIIEEKDVTTVLAVINNHRKSFETELGNCGWAEEPSKWFIMVYLRDKDYGKVIEELNKIGTFKLDVRPKGQVDLCFERASN
jgi:hypothetical protein